MFVKGENIIIVHETNHGMIGVADSYKAAIDCILDWGGELCICTNYDYGICIPLNKEEIKEVYEWDDINKFNKKFIYSYHLEVDKLWKE